MLKRTYYKDTPPPIEYAMCCDGCGKDLTDKDGKPASAMYNVGIIEKAYAAGWEPNLPGGRDLCPDCANKKKNNPDNHE